MLESLRYLDIANARSTKMASEHVLLCVTVRTRASLKQRYSVGKTTPAHCNSVPATIQSDVLVVGGYSISMVLRSKDVDIPAEPWELLPWPS